MKPFKNRREAGSVLAEAVNRLHLEKPFILALSTGAAPVACEMSKKLKAPWNLMAIQKIIVPGHPEFALGAITEEGRPIWNEDYQAFFNIPQSERAKMVEQALGEVREKSERWMRKAAPFPADGYDLILVDDAMTSGLNMEAAVEMAVRRGCGSLTAAVPIASKAAKERLKRKIDHLIVLQTPDTFLTAGLWYEEFQPVTDEKVIELLSKENLKPSLSSRHTFTEPAPSSNPEMVEAIAQFAHPIQSDNSYTPLLEKLSQKRIVMLGEATHGTEEFYKIRKFLSQRLIEDHGFNFIAVEGDWPDCYKLNQCIQLKRSESPRELMSEFKRWPTWMWSNEQVAQLIESMKGRPAGFYGLDVYSFFESIDRVLDYAEKLDPDIAGQLQEAYACLDIFDRKGIDYAKSLIAWPEGCEKEILQSLDTILSLRLDQANMDERELFDIQQNAKIVDKAEKYYRTMMFGGPDSWNVRDQHMIDTLNSLLNRYGKKSKAIVWAHNTHIGDYHATDMLSAGYVNLGGLAREKYGRDQVELVGFGTYEGEVLAGQAWDGSPEVMPLAPAAKGSYEYDFHEVASRLDSPDFYIMMENQSALKKRKGHRAVGVVYQPAFEAKGHNYVPSLLADRYDDFIFVDRTQALNRLPTSSEKGQIPDTWPVGF